MNNTKQLQYTSILSVKSKPNRCTFEVNFDIGINNTEAYMALVYSIVGTLKTGYNIMIKEQHKLKAKKNNKQYDYYQCEPSLLYYKQFLQMLVNDYYNNKGKNNYPYDYIVGGHLVD